MKIRFGAVTGTILGIFLALIIILFFVHTDKPEQIRLGYSPLIINLPIMVASEKGFFKTHDLQVNFVPMATTNTMRDAVSNGAIEFAAALGTEMFFQNNILQEGNLQAIYFNVLNQERYVDAIITNIDSDISSMQDLKSKNIGCYPASTVQAFLSLIAEHEKVEFTTTSIPPGEALQLLSAKKIDALFVIEPQLTIALQSNKFKMVDAAPIAKYVLNDVPIGAYVVNGQFAKKFPQIVTKFQLALDNAVEYIEKNQTEAISLGEKFLGAKGGQYKDANIPVWYSGCKMKNTTELDDLVAFLKVKGIVSSANPYKEFVFCGR